MSWVAHASSLAEQVMDSPTAAISRWCWLRFAQLR
jgi:hypothetical protein